MAEAAGTPPVRCRCRGRYAGCTHEDHCPEPGGGYASPYFCASCDRRRCAHITASLIEIRESLRG